MKVKNQSNVLLFLLGGVLDVAAYLCAIGIYTRVSKDPIIFFASIVIAIVTTIIICTVLYKFIRVNWDIFTTSMVGIVYFLGIMIIAIFGPTFIDRSISYHIAFYAVEEKNVNVEEMRKVFSEEIFEKRIHDAVATGFVNENQDKSLSPTIKAKIMYHVLEPIGELTDSLGTYESMKEKMSDEQN